MKKYIINILKINKDSTSEKLKTEWIIFVSDLLVALLSLYVTLRLLLGSEIQTLQMPFILKHCFVFALISFALFSWIRSYHGSSKYISLENIPGVLGCAVLANLFYHPLMLLMGTLPPLTPIVNTVLFMMGLLLPRLIAPFWRREEIKTNTVELSPKIPVVVIGYNEQIGAYLRENVNNQEDRTSFPYHLEGILLNHPLNVEDIAPPVAILGMVNDFVSIVQKLSLDGREPKRFLITQESLNHMPLRQILLKFQGRGILSLRFEISPASQEVTLRPLHLEDLVGKSHLESKPDSTSSTTWQEVQVLFDSTRVLITGVHDPVLHQLAYHVAGFYPKHLIIVDPSEHALAALKVNFDQLYPDVKCEYVLASVTDRATMDRLIRTHHPQVVIHGDRVTQPDLVASNLLMAVQKNVLSPLHLVQDIHKTEACLFVLVNAQRPTRLTRLITSLISRQIQDFDRASSKKSQTRFLVINSCDVWNNLDSGTAFWAEQLKHNLKISIPSPDAYSYLLSAEEAARTILKAIVKALLNDKSKGQALHISGGEPSRYLELIRSLSLLNGLIPEIDVKVKFSGEVVQKPSFEESDLLQSLTPGVMMGEINSYVTPQDEDLLAKLSDLLEKGQIAKIVALLEKVSMTEENADPTSFFKLTG